MNQTKANRERNILTEKEVWLYTRLKQLVSLWTEDEREKERGEEGGGSTDRVTGKENR